MSKGDSSGIHSYRTDKKPTLGEFASNNADLTQDGGLLFPIKVENPIEYQECEPVFEEVKLEPALIDVDNIKSSLSDCEIVETEETPTITVRNPLRINASYSSNSSSPVPTVNKVTVPTRIINTNSNVKTTDAPKTLNINSIFVTRPKKSEEVIEKEKQMRYLREKYPTMESMLIHDILSKHKFSVTDAMQELEMKVKTKERRNITTHDYEKWKANLANNETSKSTVETPRIVVPIAQPVTTKRLNIDEVSAATKRKAKKLRTEVVSDDSEEEATVKDNCVYNSDEDSDAEKNNIAAKDKKAILDYFRSATVGELLLIPSCSKKKVEAIIESRPFRNWSELVRIMSDNKYLTTDLLNGAQEVLKIRSNIDILMKNCKSMAKQMETAVTSGAGVKKQPALITPSKQLANYQMVGLNWLAVLHEHGVNGILADEMGLGKTIQVIAFLALLKEINAEIGIPHLVVVPASTLENWRMEFESWCPELKVLVYYGTMEERRAFRLENWTRGNLANYNVILTTYSMITNTPEERKMFRSTDIHYVIFDEAHMLKNMNSQRYENLIKIRAKFRLLLTGTPLQNNLLELISLLIFVMPHMFAGKIDDLKSLFSKTSKSKLNDDELPVFDKIQIKQAKDIMKPFLLRRLKKDVLQDLPKKTDELIRVPLAPTQLDQYENLVYHYQNLGKRASEATPYSPMTMMTELRKLSNHPLLLKYYYQYEDLEEIAKILANDPGYKETVVQHIIDDLGCMSDFEIHNLCKQFFCLNQFELPDNLILTSGKFLYLDKKLKELKNNGHRVLIFSQYVIMLNIVEEYLQLRKYSYLRLDGSTPVVLRQELIDQYSSDPNIFIFLLSTKAGGLGINLTAADTVIIHDIDFNPYNDKQAEDRCHRIGQTKPVGVYRLVSHCTIEEGMWHMNQEKLNLEKEVTAEESDNPGAKSVVRLLSSVLGIESAKVTNLLSASTANEDTPVGLIRKMT